MKKLFFIPIFFLAACNSSPNADSTAGNDPNTPLLNEQIAVGQEAEEKCDPMDAFVPKGWKIIKKAQGDLNKDGRIDVAFVVQNTDPKNVVKDEYMELDSNHRQLFILFATDQDNCYRLNTQSSTFILAHTEANMDDPFSGMEIKNGTLRFQFTEFYNMGSWYNTQYSYIWRFQDDAFKLIGANVNEFHRASGEAKDVSVNFSTGKYSITSYNMFDENVKEVENWKQLKSKTLQTFKSFPKPWSWKVNDDIYL